MEPFKSDRHGIDAKDWRELHDKSRFLLQSGRKSLLENLPFLPHKVEGRMTPQKLPLEVVHKPPLTPLHVACVQVIEADFNTSEPVLADWEYRIACHPLKKHVPLHLFRPAQDLSVQLNGANGRPLTMGELEHSRWARFEMNQVNSSKWDDGRRAYTLLDELMEGVPGKDNYGAELFDDSFGANSSHIKTGETLNTAYYSRYYKVANDAMGRANHRRGFNDGNFWAAMTTQEQIAGVTSCTSSIFEGRSPRIVRLFRH